MKNKYTYRSKISEQKYSKICLNFCFDLASKKVAAPTMIFHPVINKIYHQIREKIALECEKECPFENEEIELDESYFEVKCIQEKRGQDAFEIRCVPKTGVPFKKTDERLRSSGQ